MKLRGIISASTEAKGGFATGAKEASCFFKLSKFILYQGAEWLQTFYPVRYQIAIADVCKVAQV